ncbi:MAG: radical SAM protein [Candidatus Firestonebacteria bacterium]|nr:radical SAM protein [Candidatus Firestonebacteria bacterium]
MKILMLNPPYEHQIMRRFISTYYAPNFLLPPYELMSLGTIAIQWKKADVILIDAIAEKLNLENIIEFIKKYEPEILVSMPGFESFSSDIESLSCIKKIFPQIKIIIVGYLPSIFPEEILSSTNIDIIIRGEPELIFSYLYDLLEKRVSFKTLLGISFRDSDKIIHNPPAPRINELDNLPFPDPNLINLKSYREPYLGSPMMAFYASRGCSGSCIYCVKSFGARIYYASPEIIVKKLKWYKNSFKINNFRFLDDNFTSDKNQAIEICQRIIEQKLNISWSCLSRIDTLDYELVMNMKNAGCKRIYLGIESGSDRILKLYNKKYTAFDIKSKMSLLKTSGLDFSAFFIVGAPSETEEDLKLSINMAIDINFDFIIVTRLKFIPGTELFEQYKDKIEFSLFPYKVTFKLPLYEQNTLEWEKQFYYKFYFRYGFYLKKLKLLFFAPINILRSAYFLIKFLKNDSKRDFI